MVVLIIGGELALGNGRDALWESVNAGRTFKSYDWSKFDKFDEDEDEEEEEEEEEEGGDDDDE